MAYHSFIAHHPLIVTIILLFILITFTGLGVSRHPSRSPRKHRWEAWLAAVNFGLMVALFAGLEWNDRGAIAGRLHTHPLDALLGLAVVGYVIFMGIKMIFLWLGIGGKTATKGEPSAV